MVKIFELFVWLLLWMPLVYSGLIPPTLAEILTVRIVGFFIVSTILNMIVLSYLTGFFDLEERPYLKSLVDNVGFFLIFVLFLFLSR